MASRKEEKERLRREREAAEKQHSSQDRKRLILGYTVAGLITLAVVVGIVVVIAGGGGDSQGTNVEAGENERVNTLFGVVPDDLKIDDRSSASVSDDDTGVVGGDVSTVQTLADAANCELLLDQEDEGNTHLGQNADVPDYEASPPTSGDHLPDPLADGAYTTAPSPLNFIHSLEHGRIEIQYHADLPEEQQEELLGIYDQSRPGVLIFPNDDQPYTVAATAWRQTLGCDEVDAETITAIRGFREAFRGRGPEPIALQ